ncbi:MAG: EF-hand domain-containing protein [Pigmentiphaga sp.]|nr:EF-hand domain-containing protein [Pigmentiphaga sp.]
MKKSLALAFALGLAAPMAALAQSAPLDLSQEHFEQLDVDKNGRISEVEYRQFMDGAFTKLDADGNGRLSPSETASVLTAEQFAIVDSDKNGELSRTEFLDQVMRDFRRADDDSDGHLQYP